MNKWIFRQPENQNTMNITAYVINLDRRPDRRDRFFAHPDAHHFTRVSAVDKLDLAKHAYLKDNLFNSQPILDWFPFRTEVTLGEVACTLSHIECWRKIAANPNLLNHDYAIVAEDDIVLIPDFAAVWQRVLNIKSVAERKYDLMTLHRLHTTVPNDGSTTAQLASLTSTLHCGSFANVRHYDSASAALYAIKKSFAQALIRQLQSTKPYWLADLFSRFCAPEQLIAIIPMLGSTPLHGQDSDLESERINVIQQTSFSGSLKPNSSKI